MAKGKSKSIKKASAPATSLTLDNITISWLEGQHGRLRTANGRVIAWLLRRAAHLSMNADLDTLDVTTGTGPQLLRGFGEAMYPDAGSPAGDLYDDTRWFMNWALGEIAAQQHADLMDDATHPSKFTVTVTK
jgi:hypothetical protein